MIKLFIFFLTILPAFSASELKLSIPEPEVQQGEIIEVSLEVKAEDLKGLELQSLKNDQFAETIYFLQISPLMRKEGNDVLQAEARMIFTQVPKSNQVAGKLGESTVTISWNSVKITPTEASPELIFGNFEIPSRQKLIFWSLLALIVLVLLGLLSWYYFKKFQTRKLEKERLVKMKNEILNCRNYDDVVQLWKKKHDYYHLFPHIVEPFQKLEMVLNRHQFKPSQSEEERKEILDSYRKFTISVEGGFIGI